MKVLIPEPERCGTCGTCGGDGVVGVVTMSYCPDCRCVQCGQRTDTAPICADCVNEVEARLAS